MQRYPLISVVILNYNGKGIIEPCLASVLNNDYPNFEVVLVDNASTDDSIQAVEEMFPDDGRLKIVKNSVNSFYAGGNNIGINHSKGECIFVINNDTEIDRHCLKEIAQAMNDENIGAAQPKILIYGQDTVIDNTGGLIDRFGYTKGRGRHESDIGQYDNLNDIFFAGGTAMILKRKVLEEVGAFDPKFVAHWEDVDLSWRIRLKGYKIKFVPKARIYHKISGTINQYGSRNKISFHIRKNRISGLLKNYSTVNLLKSLPVLLLIYLMIFIKESIIDMDIKMALSSFSAIAWNINELPYIFKMRRFVQSTVRRIPDAQITGLMERNCLLMDFLKEMR